MPTMDYIRSEGSGQGRFAGRTDLGYGRTLPRRLRSTGLIDIVAEVSFSLWFCQLDMAPR